MPYVAAGDCVYVDPDEPAEHGRLVAAWHDNGETTSVRLMVVEGERCILRTLKPDWSDIAVTRGNETMIRGVVVFVGRRV